MAQEKEKTDLSRSVVMDANILLRAPFWECAYDRSLNVIETRYFFSYLPRASLKSGNISRVYAANEIGIWNLRYICWTPSLRWSMS